MLINWAFIHNRRTQSNASKKLVSGFVSSLISLLILPMAAVHAEDASEQKTEPEAVAQPAKTTDTVLLKATVSDEIFPQLERCVTDLVTTAIENEADAADMKKKGVRYNKTWSRIWAGTRDIAELLTEYKGFEQSSEAGDIILGEKFKLKSKASADCVKQLKRDRIERAVMADMLQLAQGLGYTDEDDKKKTIDAGLAHLGKLVGDDQAHKALETLTNCSANIKVNAAVFDQKALNVLELEQQSAAVFDKALSTDDVIAEITHTVHKYYNGRKNLARVTAKVMNATLSIAGYSPTMLAPASQLAWTVYIATQGGPEESKLLKEVYLGKRFESRLKTLSACATLAVNSHNSAIQTKNVPLLSVSEWMIDRVSQEDGADKYLTGTNASSLAMPPVGLH